MRTMLGNPPKPKRSSPPDFMLAIGVPAHKPGDMPPGKDPVADEPEPKPEAGEPEEHEQKITPEAAFFTGPDHVCYNCEHFQNVGVGECDEVSADYAKNDPMSSQCRLWEGKESPEVEKQEEMPA